MKGMKLIFVMMLLSIIVATLWDKIVFIKDAVHAALDPTFGSFLDWNIHLGFFVIVAILTFLTTLLQKYATDQATLRKIKEEQKLLQQEIKKFTSQPEKIMEFNKKSLELTTQAMPLAMRPVLFTAIPFILLFRWFGDYFHDLSIKIFGIFSAQGSFLLPGWVWAYILSSIIVAAFLRKWMKVY